MIGIAQLQRPLRHPVKARQHRIRLEIERGELRPHRFRQRGDVARIVKIGRQRAQRRLPAHRGQRLERLVHHCRARRRAILRIERRDQDAFAPGILHRLQLRRDRRIAIAHRPVDRHFGPMTRKCRLQRHRLPPGDRSQRRSVIGPHLLIGMRRLGRARAQDDAAQDRLPDQRRNLHHAAIRQKLAQIAPHRPRIGRVGRAQIDQQHADPPRRDRGVAFG